MAKHDFSIDITGMVSNLGDIKTQLQNEKFEIDIKLTPSSQKVINELKQLTSDLKKAFDSLNSININTNSKATSFGGNISGIDDTLTEKQLANYEKKWSALIKKVRAEMALGEQGLYQFKNASLPKETFESINRTLNNDRVHPLNINNNAELQDALIILDKQEARLNLISKRWNEIKIASSGVKTDAQNINETIEKSKVENVKQSITSNIEGKLIEGENKGVFDTSAGKDLKDQYEDLIRQIKEVDVANQDYAKTIIDIKTKISELEPEYKKARLEAEKLAKVSKETVSQLSPQEMAARKKSQEILASQITSKLNMGSRSGLFESTVSVDGNSYVGKEVEDSYRKALKAVQELDVGSKNYKETIIELQTEVAKLNPAYQALQKTVQKTFDKTDNWFNNFRKKAANFIYYRTISAIFNTIENAGKSLVKITFDINTEVRDINKVLDVTEKQMDNLVLSANKLANQYSRVTIEVLKAMEYFAKVGYGLSQLEAFAELSIKLQNVGDLTSEASSQFLIAANAAFQFNKDADKLAKTIDIVNNLSNNAAVTVGFLSDAIKVGGAVAHSAGLSLEEFASMATTVGEATQRGGREVGNGIKTIIMRLTQVNDTAEDAQEALSNSDKVLTKIGINVRDTANSFRPAMDVLTELAHKYEELTDLERKEINYNLAGVYRSNILESFLKNITDYENNLYIALNSVGSATRENKIYLNSLEAGIKKVKAAWEAFVIKLQASKFLKGVLDVVAFAVKNLSTILRSISYSTLTVMIIKMGMLISSSIKAGESVKKLSDTISALKKGLTSTSGIIGMIAIALAAIITIINNVNSAAERAMERTRESIRASKEEMEVLIAKYGQMNIMIKQYETLRDQYKKTGEGVQELKDLQSELNAEYGDQARRIDLVNGKYEDNIELMRQIREETLRKTIEEGKTGYSLAKNQLSKNVDELGLWKNKEILKRNQTSWLELIFKDTNKDVRDFFGLGILESIDPTTTTNMITNKVRKMSLDEYISMLKDLENSLRDKLDNGGGKLTEQQLNKVVEWLKSAEAISDEANEQIESQVGLFKNLAQEIVSGELIKLQGKEKSVYDIVASQLELVDFSIEGTEEYANKLKELIDIIDGVNAENIEEKWAKLFNILPNLTVNDKERIFKAVANEATQISNLIDASLEKLDGLKKKASEMELVRNATSSLYDLRRKIADESGLIGEDYSSFAESGNIGKLPQDEKYDKLRSIAKDLQDDYLKYIDDIQKSELEGLNNQETITKLYETQVKLKEKELAILTKELAIDEKRKNLNNLQGERNQVTYINGKMVYTVDYEAISKAQDELTKAEQEKAKSESELQTDIALSVSEIEILKFKDSISEFELATKNGEEGLTAFLENLDNVSEYLKINLKDDLEAFGKMLRDISADNQLSPLINVGKNMTNRLESTLKDIFNDTFVNGQPTFSIDKIYVNGVNNVYDLIEEMKSVASLGNGSKVSQSYIK